MSSTPDWKRNLDALGAFLGPTGPTAKNAGGAPSVTDVGSKLLQALAFAGESGAPLDALAERIGASFRVCAEAAQSLEMARLISIDRSDVIAVVRLTEVGRQIAAAAPLANAA